MNIDTALYRMHIGLFGPGRGYKGSSRYNMYQAYVKGTYIHWTMRIGGLYLLAQICQAEMQQIVFTGYIY